MIDLGYDTKASLRRSSIKYIVIHDTEGLDSRNWLSRRNRVVPSSIQNKVSIHLLARRDAEIYRIVPDELAAWHAGRGRMPQGETNTNDCSLGLEFEHYPGQDWPVVQLAGGADVVREWINQYRIPGKFVVSHASIALPRGRKMDPINFPWDIFWTHILSKSVWEGVFQK